MAVIYYKRYDAMLGGHGVLYSLTSLGFWLKIHACSHA